MSDFLNSIDYSIHLTTCINLDLCICTIPTVAFYRKHGEIISPPLFPESHDHYHHTSG